MYYKTFNVLYLNTTYPIQVIDDDLIDYKNSTTIKRSRIGYHEERWLIFRCMFVKVVWTTDNWWTANKK